MTNTTDIHTLSTQAEQSVVEPTRQVHLDFHTSEHIPDVGARFDPQQFKHALQLGRVELINIFAKCHHSWSYYPTKVGMPHPHLCTDLLGGQLEACREIGVKAPIYYTVGWSANDAAMHPEWCMRDETGGLILTDGELDAAPDAARPRCSWINLCPSGGYQDLMLAQTEELCRAYPVDGFWYDIILPSACYCDTCQRQMRELHLNPKDPQDVLRNRVVTVRRHADELRRLIHSYHPGVSVYFNSLTHISRATDPTSHLFDVNSKNDLEDLPTTWGGYDKFPTRAKYFHKQNKPVVAMSGKFHTSWGEFGGFKHADAMRHEVASMLAFGAACNFGDQLHPSGEMDLQTYANIGAAFAYAEQVDEYGRGGRPVASLAIWPSGVPGCDEGLSRMLLESQIDYDVIDDDQDLSMYETIVIASAVELLPAQVQRLQAYVDAGGSLLAMGSSLLDVDAGVFHLDVGADYLGQGSYDVDYLSVDIEQLQYPHQLACSPFLNYCSGLKLRPHAQTQVLAAIHEPYFSRSYARYCSHLNTPPQPEPAAHPGLIRKGNIIYAAHDLDVLYGDHGARVHRDFFVNTLALLHQHPMVEVDLPSGGRVSLLHQADQSRYVLHLLYGPAMPRGRCVVIEDLVPIHDTLVRLDLPVEIKQLRLIPDQQTLQPHVSNGKIEVTVSVFTSHCALVCDY